MSDFMKDLFDLNGDGEVDMYEKTGVMRIFEEISEDEIEEEDEDEEDDDELELAGLDRDELEFMDEEERRGVLEEAGLDPDEYDF